MFTKKINYILLVVFTGTLFLTSCSDNLEEITSFITDRLFSPIDFTCSNVKTSYTFSWAKVDSATSYTFQVSTDSLDFSASKLVVDTTLTETTFIQEFQGSTQYYAHLIANASNVTKSSKFNQLSFKTPSENLFTGFGISNNTGKVYSAYMTDFNSLSVYWQPASNVTHLILTSSDNSIRDSIPLTSDDAASGMKIVNSLVNSKWTVQIYNKTFLRGTTTGTVEGDVLLNIGDDLQAALTNASDGQVIVLQGGGVYNTGSGAYLIDKSVKVRGLSVSDRPVICMTTGTGTPPSSSSNMLGFAANSTLQNVTFENIDFTGYVDNSTSGTKIGYLFNNGTMTTVSKLSFLNCNIHNFGNTPLRLKNNVNQVIDTLSINGCVINDIGFTSTYAIINTNSADFINTIIMSNSTFYYFKGSLILRTGQSLNSVQITNCNINQGMQDPNSARYLFDFNTATFNGTGVSIQNCIFGSTGGTSGANGIRYATGVTVSITGSYYTSDYVDDPIPAGVTSTSIKSYMTSYSGLSTSLWVNPLAGNFKFLDSSFAGTKTVGDPRWQ